MDNRVYWIWLQNAFGAGSPKPVQLVRRIGSAEKLYQAAHDCGAPFRSFRIKSLPRSMPTARNRPPQRSSII